MQADSILYRKLKEEAKKTNYSKLANEIIKDIDLSKLPEKNLIFIYNDKPFKMIFNNEPCKCCFESLSTNPVYNDPVFWSKKNIKLMVKEFKKNLIPRNGTRHVFIYDKLMSKSTTNFGKLTADTKKQKKGKYIEMYNGSNEEEQNFFYFPFHKKEDLLLVKNTETDNRNYDELYLKFTNYLGKIVTIRYEYNEDNSIYKTYQYQNKKWVEIPTIDEYKF